MSDKWRGKLGCNTDKGVAMTNNVCMYVYKGSAKHLFFFFEKCFKKTTEVFLKFLFLFESTILPFNNGK